MGIRLVCVVAGTGVIFAAGCGSKAANPVRRQAEAAGYVQYGCANCHVYRGVGRTNLSAPDLSHVGSRLGEQAIAEKVRCPACRDAKAVMPAYTTLTAGELHRLSAFLAASR
jgi:hypothetical protein